MAQINFPTATANGQTFEADNGVIYTYVGTPPNGYWSGTFQDQGLQTLDGRYLKLDSSNDPLTGGLSVSSGNVGIGTLTPSQRLEISDSAPRLRLTDSNTTAAAGATSYIEFQGSDARAAIIYHDSNGLNLQADAAGGNAVRFLTGGVNERVRIDSSGNVGIGTSNPASLLHVDTDAGNFQVSSFGVSSVNIENSVGGGVIRHIAGGGHRFSSNDSTELVRITGAGLVGIGTSSPSQLLSVTGPGISTTFVGSLISG